jgi:hypothetical protein
MEKPCTAKTQRMQRRKNKKEEKQHSLPPAFVFLCIFGVFAVQNLN